MFSDPYSWDTVGEHGAACGLSRPNTAWRSSGVTTTALRLSVWPLSVRSDNLLLSPRAAADWFVGCLPQASGEGLARISEKELSTKRKFF
jgi:hypothetical protein